MKAYHDIETATHIEVDAGVRYWEDATVNGVKEDNDNPAIFGAQVDRWNDNPDIFGAQVDRWKVKIRLADGLIEGWPQGMEACVHYKVCDDGLYWLLNAAGERIAERDNYVPGDFLCHGDEGYGDYIILNIGGDGLIRDYSVPSIYDYDWELIASEVAA